MKTFINLSIEEQKEVYNKAWLFKHNHSDHVENLIKDEQNIISPSGSDLFYPELWKPMHWKWFIERIQYEMS